MSFGFPAYHTERFTVYASQTDLGEAVFEALETLRWAIQEDSGDRISASVCSSFRSWGERITIKFHRDGSLSITSRCALPTQCFDWGKNQANVTILIEELRKAAKLGVLKERRMRAGQRTALDRGRSPGSQDIQESKDRFK
jgi:hypothetical protein